MKRRVSLGLIVAVLFAVPVGLMAQDTTDPAPTAPPTPVAKGLYQMVWDKSVGEVYFSTTATLEANLSAAVTDTAPWAYDISLFFCKALMTRTVTKADGTTSTFDDEYAMLDQATGGPLATQFYPEQNKMAGYPWVSEDHEPKPATKGNLPHLIPQSRLERQFLHHVLLAVEASNDGMDDTAWADPKNRLGVGIDVAGDIEFAAGQIIYQMTDTQFYVFPRKGAVTIVVHDNVMNASIQGDRGLTWPRE